jgi:hypothetical protein
VFAVPLYTIVTALEGGITSGFGMPVCVAADTVTVIDKYVLVLFLKTQ